MARSVSPVYRVDVDDFGSNSRSPYLSNIS